MQNDNLGIGVMSSVNFKDRYTACQLTWLKDFDNTFIFGGHNANLSDPILVPIENAGEDWFSCFLKQQLGLKYMYEQNPNLDWYCIVGCDSVLFKDRLLKELSKYNPSDDLFLSEPCGLWTDFPRIKQISHVYEKEPFGTDLAEGCTCDYCNFIRSTSPGGNGIVFRSISGGAGFFISNSLMKKCNGIINEFNQIWTNMTSSPQVERWIYGCADVALAYMIKRYFNIDVTHILNMTGQSPQHLMNPKNWGGFKNFGITALEVLKSPISLHYIKYSDMSDIYEKYKIDNQE